MRYTWLVEKYLEGELSGEALQKFELEILRNPEAARELEKIRSLQKFMENHHTNMRSTGGLIEDFDDLENVMPEHEIAGELEDLMVRKIQSPAKHLEDFRTTLSEVEAERTLKNRHSKKLILRKASVWTAAASIALLLVTSTLLIISNTGTTHYQAIYSEHFIPGKADVNQRSINGREATLMDAALRLYNEGFFAEAIVQFNQVPEPDAYPGYPLYKGITLMKLDRHNEAIEQFFQLTDPVLKHYGMWYTGLCYLALEDPDHARSVFQDIVDQEGHYMNNARRILRKI